MYRGNSKYSQQRLQAAANIKVTSPTIVSAMFRKLVDKNRKNRKSNYFSKRNNPYKRRKKWASKTTQTWQISQKEQEFFIATRKTPNPRLNIELSGPCKAKRYLFAKK